MFYLDKKEDEILAQEIREDLTTYEQIRHRITKLLQSEKAKEINRDVSLTIKVLNLSPLTLFQGELTAALARIEGKIDDSLVSQKLIIALNKSEFLKTFGVTISFSSLNSFKTIR